jgi:hypothetical protein
MQTFVVSIWVVLGYATPVLAIYRQVLTAHHERDVVHLAVGEQREIAEQSSLAARLNTIDGWGKTMTVVIAVIGLGFATAYLIRRGRVRILDLTTFTA